MYIEILKYPYARIVFNNYENNFPTTPIGKIPAYDADAMTQQHASRYCAGRGKATTGPARTGEPAATHGAGRAADADPRCDVEFDPFVDCDLLLRVTHFERATKEQQRERREQRDGRQSGFSGKGHRLSDGESSTGGTPSKLFRNEFKSCAILGLNGLFGRIIYQLTKTDVAI